jgi:UPF0716 protein FxsA
MMRVRQAMDRGEVPALEMLEGAVLLLGGLLLLIPGFFTDALGFLFLIPMLRKLLAKALLHRGLMMGSSQFTARSWQHTSHPHRDDSKGKTIEGDYIRRDDD